MGKSVGEAQLRIDRWLEGRRLNYGDYSPKYRVLKDIEYFFSLAYFLGIGLVLVGIYSLVISPLNPRTLLMYIPVAAVLMALVHILGLETRQLLGIENNVLRTVHGDLTVFAVVSWGTVMAVRFIIAMMVVGLFVFAVKVPLGVNSVVLGLGLISGWKIIQYIVGKNATGLSEEQLKSAVQVNTENIPNGALAEVDLHNWVYGHGFKFVVGPSGIEPEERMEDTVELQPYRKPILVVGPEYIDWDQYNSYNLVQEMDLALSAEEGNSMGLSIYVWDQISDEGFHELDYISLN